MATETTHGNLRVLMLSPEEAARVIAFLAAQLARGSVSPRHGTGEPAQITLERDNVRVLLCVEGLTPVVDLEVTPPKPAAFVLLRDPEGRPR